LPDFDVGLATAAENERIPWAFHRAPEVLATRITGISNECCTGAGGMYFTHEVTRDFRGDRGEVAAAATLLGGHGYYSEEQCGDAFLVAGSNVSSVPAGTESYFACEAPGSLPPPYEYQRTANEHVKLADSPEARLQVERWVAAPDPVYLLHDEGSPPSAPVLDERAIWSQPVSMLRALAGARFAWIRVVAVTREGDRNDVVLETTFDTNDLEGLRRRVRLSATCLDPRLLREGATWLAPLVVDQTSSIDDPLEAGAFLVPGVLFPADGRAEDITQALHYTPQY
jgi:hypothetical protein